MADIFISYSQKDRPRVKQLVDALTAEGYEVWWDLKIRAGESFDEVIENTLEQVSCVVGVWSQHSVRSNWVRAESAWAKDRGVFVSVRIDTNAQLPLKFYQVHTASLGEWTGDRDDPRFRRLVADVRRIAVLPPSPAPAHASGMQTSTSSAERPQQQQPVPASQSTPPAIPETARSPQPGWNSVASASQARSRSFGVALWIISSAFAAVVAAVILKTTQIHVGQGDNISAGRDVVINAGIPESVVDKWFSELRAQGARKADVAVKVDRLRQDFQGWQQNLGRRAEREPAIRPTLKDVARGDLPAAEAQLGKVLDREIRTQHYTSAASTAKLLGQLKSLQLDANAAKRFEALRRELLKSATANGSRSDDLPPILEHTESLRASDPPVRLSESISKSVRSEEPVGVVPYDTVSVAERLGKVTVPAGQFRMGCVSGQVCLDSELPVRTVIFDKPFAIGRHEVTFAEYDRFVEATNRRRPHDRGWGRDDRPVVDVSWEDAKDYAEWLSVQTSKHYRLPTEAEWEYATRAGTETPFSFHDDDSDLGMHAWYAWNAKGQTHPVGEKKPNPWGLNDVHGNVREWVQDCWHEDYKGAPTDGSAWGEEGGGNCGQRVLRGGSWNFNPVNLRSADRSRNDADYRSYTIGFRLAQDL